MNKKILWTAVAIVALVVVGSIICININHVNSNSKNTAPINTNNPDNNNLAVQKTVYNSHGQSVPAAAVEEKYAALAPTTNITKQEVADAIVTKNILVVKAEQKNITATDDEINNFIAEQLTQYSISKEEYNQRLEAAGITEEQYKTQLKDQIIIAKLINESIKAEDYAVSDEEVDAFMNAHKEDYESLDSNILTLIKQRIKAQMIEKKKSDLVNKYIKQI